MFAAVKVPEQCPLVLGCQQGGTLGNIEYKVMGSGFCEYATWERVEYMGRISSLRKLGSVCGACILEIILKLMLRRPAREACRAAWILGTNWPFAPL